jgi:hypothetical protein
MPGEPDPDAPLEDPRLALPPEPPPPHPLPPEPPSDANRRVKCFPYDCWCLQEVILAARFVRSGEKEPTPQYPPEAAAVAIGNRLNAMCQRMADVYCTGKKNARLKCGCRPKADWSFVTRDRTLEDARKIADSGAEGAVKVKLALPARDQPGYMQILYMVSAIDGGQCAES